MKRKLQELIPLANPKKDSAWKAYLEYLLEYKPEQAWSLFQSKKLEKLLDDKATQIANLELSLLKQGRPMSEAREIAYQEFMPSNTDLPEQESIEIVQDDQNKQILAWARQTILRPSREI